MDPATAAAITEAGSNITQNSSNIGMYYLQRHHALKDYQRNRADALSDFNMANRYNSPQEQMNRLREAGLNPNLVYGKGADQASVQMKGPDLDTPIAPKIEGIDINRARAMGQSLQQNKAQTDNVLADTKNKELQGALTTAQTNQTNMQTANIAENTARTRFDLQQASELKDSVLMRARLENEAIQTNITTALNGMELAKVKSASDKAQAIQQIAESRARVLSMQLQNAVLPMQKQKLQNEIDMLQMNILNADLDRRIKNIELDLRKDGINPNDPTWSKELWDRISSWWDKDDQFVKQEKKRTFGGREGFDKEGNPMPLWMTLGK
jgi:hypothetical protein